MDFESENVTQSNSDDGRVLAKYSLSRGDTYVNKEIANSPPPHESTGSPNSVPSSPPPPPLTANPQYTASHTSQINKPSTGTVPDNNGSTKYAEPITNFATLTSASQKLVQHLAEGGRHQRIDYTKLAEQNYAQNIAEFNERHKPKQPTTLSSETRTENQESIGDPASPSRDQPRELADESETEDKASDNLDQSPGSSESPNAAGPEMTVFTTTTPSSQQQYVPEYTPAMLAALHQQQYRDAMTSAVHHHVTQQQQLVHAQQEAELSHDREVSDAAVPSFFFFTNLV